MKKLFLLFCLALAAERAAAYDAEVGGIYYNLIEKGSIAEVTSGEKPYSGDVVIPEAVKVGDTEYRVTTIGAEAFMDCKDLHAIKLSSNITVIGDYAFFRCTGLESIDFSTGVVRIGEGSFWVCSSLRSMDIPDQVETIGNSAFRECYSLESLRIGPSVTKLGGAAFSGCKMLKNIDFGTSLTEISGSAFEGCIGLTIIRIPETIVSIGRGAFADCKDLKEVYCYGHKPVTDQSAFDGSYVEYASLYVHEEDMDDYKASSPWNLFGTIANLSADGIRPATDTKAVKAVYTLDGQRVEQLHKGLNIIIHNDGTVSKTMRR